MLLVKFVPLIWYIFCRRETNLTPFVQIWDLSTATPSLLSTFSFASPVSHVAWDPLERFFFAACSEPQVATPAKKDESVGTKVMKISLYRKKKDEYGYEMSEAIGGGGRGEVETAVESGTYAVS